MKNIKVGDLVEEIGTDSGHWRVVEVYKNTRVPTTVAKLELPGHPNCTTHVAIEMLAKVG